MHYLHPRSRTTSTLFTTTLAVSFLVVGLPHLLPCPVDQRQFADSIETPDGRVRRRRRQKPGDDAAISADVQQSEDNSSGPAISDRAKRECPVPKPSGIVGNIMGFKEQDRRKPAEVVVLNSRTKEGGA